MEYHNKYCQHAATCTLSCDQSWRYRYSVFQSWLAGQWLSGFSWSYHALLFTESSNFPLLYIEWNCAHAASVYISWEQKVGTSYSMCSLPQHRAFEGCSVWLTKRWQSPQEEKEDVMSIAISMFNYGLSSMKKGSGW